MFEVCLVDSTGDVVRIMTPVIPPLGAYIEVHEEKISGKEPTVYTVSGLPDFYFVDRGSTLYTIELPVRKGVWK